MSLTLNYTVLHAYDTRLEGITVPAAVTLGAAVVRFDAKVDTGSTHCVFQREHGEELGLIIESGFAQRFRTAAGSFQTYGHEVTLTVLGIETTAMVFFAADEAFPANVLGRVGWLDRVCLGLVDCEGRLYLSDYNDPA